MSDPKPTSLTSLNSNTFLEDAASAIVVPSRSIAKDYLHRDLKLNRIEDQSTPGERLLLLVRSLLDPKVDSTHESNWIKNLTLSGGFGAAVVGGLFNSKDIHEQYVRKNNASVFSGKYIANRHFWDTLVSGCAARGIKYGVRATIMCFSASFIGFGSVVYRNKLYAPDFVIGFATFGALSRLWLGSRAMFGGAMIGAITGLGGYGILKLSELMTSQTVTQLRLLNHAEYLSRRQSRLKEMQLLQEENTKAFMDQNYGR